MPPGAPFRVGDRVRVSGGYDMDPKWLQGCAGYDGTVTAIDGSWAAVELDEDVEPRANAEAGWANFGSGSATQLGTVNVVRGRSLALPLGWVGAGWEEPIGRLHVGLCAERPSLTSIPKGGRIGAWVESHATMIHLAATS